MAIKDMGKFHNGGDVFDVASWEVCSSHFTLCTCTTGQLRSGPSTELPLMQSFKFTELGKEVIKSSKSLELLSRTCSMFYFENYPERGEGQKWNLSNSWIFCTCTTYKSFVLLFGSINCTR